MAAAALLFAAACQRTSPAPTEDITIWEPRGHWSGQGVLQTDPFISTTGLLRVTWEARGSGTLRIVLHSDVSGRSLTPVLDQTGSGKGIKYITEDPRSFFFVIESKDLEWTVDVAEGLAATRPR